MEFKDETNLAELIGWIRENTTRSVIVALPKTATKSGEPVVLHWYNKPGEVWTRNHLSTDEAVQRMKADARSPWGEIPE